MPSAFLCTYFVCFSTSLIGTGLFGDVFFVGLRLGIGKNGLPPCERESGSKKMSFHLTCVMFKPTLCQYDLNERQLRVQK